MKPKVVIGLIIAALLLIILLQNTEVVQISILFWTFSMTRIILLPLLLLIGFVVGFFVGRQSRYW